MQRDLSGKITGSEVREFTMVVCRIGGIYLHAVKPEDPAVTESRKTEAAEQEGSRMQH